MTESHGFSEADLDVLAEEAAKEMQKATGLQERLRELVGRAESRDGRVRLGLTAEGKIVEMEIDPRAMRMASAELAETIMQLSADASQDLQRQSRELVEDPSLAPEGVADIVRDPKAIEDQLKHMQNGFQQALDDSMAIMDDLRRKMGR